MFGERDDVREDRCGIIPGLRCTSVTSVVFTVRTSSVGRALEKPSETSWIARSQKPFRKSGCGCCCCCCAKIINDMNHRFRRRRSPDISETIERRNRRTVFVFGSIIVVAMVSLWMLSAKILVSFENSSRRIPGAPQPPPPPPPRP